MLGRRFESGPLDSRADRQLQARVLGLRFPPLFAETTSRPRRSCQSAAPVSATPASMTRVVLVRPSPLAASCLRPLVPPHPSPARCILSLPPSSALHHAPPYVHQHSACPNTINTLPALRSAHRAAAVFGTPGPRNAQLAHNLISPADLALHKSGAWLMRRLAVPAPARPPP